MYTLSVSLAKAYLLSSMSVASCVDDDAKIGNNFESPIGVSHIFSLFLAVRVHSISTSCVFITLFMCKDTMKG